jgi:branched-chain amino acid aminotransferase
MGIKVIEQNVPRESLYLADEVFFTGSAAEISPISRIDDIKIGSGKRGPITEQLQKTFFEIVNGKVEDKFDWLTPIPKYKRVTVK